MVIKLIQTILFAGGEKWIPGEGASTPQVDAFREGTYMFCKTQSN